MIIREFAPSDRETFIRLCTEFYYSPAVLHPVPAENIEATADVLEEGTPFAKCYIMEENGVAAGYCLLAVTYSNEAGGICKWIEELYVSEKFRSGGIGGKMLDYIEKNEGCARLRLEAEKENAGAVRLYKRKGFKPLQYIQFVKDM